MRRRLHNKATQQPDTTQAASRLLLSDLAQDKDEFSNPLTNSGHLLSVVEVKGQSPCACEPERRGEEEVGVGMKNAAAAL